VGKNKNAPGETTFPGIDKFPDKLHRDIKVLAAQKGITVKEVVIQALRLVLSNQHLLAEKASDKIS
jgi:hypothetical protein